MTAEYPPTKPRHGDQPEEQPRPEQGDVERETPSKDESEMSKGKNHPSAPPENQGAFEPESTRTPQGGGPG